MECWDILLYGKCENEQIGWKISLYGWGIMHGDSWEDTQLKHRYIALNNLISQVRANWDKYCFVWWWKPLLKPYNFLKIFIQESKYSLLRIWEISNFVNFWARNTNSFLKQVIFRQKLIWAKHLLYLLGNHVEIDWKCPISDPK